MELSVEEINSKYDLKFDENYKELFDIIIQIFNNKMNLENYDLSNSKILNILDLYYEFKEENYTQAIKYYQMALELGNTDAMCNLACYYDKEKDYDQAIQYYQMASELDNTNAMCNLARYYNEKENYVQAIQYYQMAIKLGNSTAMNNLAYHYEKKEKDYPQAIEYYQMAIKLGNSTAMCNLALHYYEKEKDYTQAIQYYRMAANLGNSTAMNNLAFCYHEKEKDYTQAIQYYRMASELGNTNAMKNLSFMSTVSPIKVFMEIDLVENPNEFIINLKAKLKKNHEVIIFENKKRLSIKYNIIEYCPICSNTKLSINLDCGHFVCVDCYHKIDLVNSSEFIIKLKKEFEINHKVMIFENKKRLSLKYNIIEHCPICLDTKLCINLDCGHLVCVDCYDIINCCYLKCCS